MRLYDCTLGYGHDYAAFGGAFIVGGFSVVFQEIILVCALGSIVLYGNDRRDRSASPARSR